MSDIAIRVEGLGKRYSLRHQVRQVGLRHVLQDAVTSLWKPRRPALQAAKAPAAAREDFWALRDVSFEVKRGEVVGIIGRNGAGKSTLLKILSRITEPTTGSVEIEGRVASLLEVGTGFHPELTGRENVYLNGAILGMSRAEIRKKFDEIVDFAEVEKFLDTPVKHYSSGMYVRLAFAVAAHLEPEILIVDEVLAVGDAQFQKKCLGKMQDVSEREGRTVFFVSHNMGAVRQLCTRCLLLNHGAVQRHGETQDCINDYLSIGAFDHAEREWSLAEAPGKHGIKLRRIRICQPSGTPNHHIRSDQPFVIEIDADWSRTFPQVGLSLKIYNREGQLLLHTFDLWEEEASAFPPGMRKHECYFPRYLFNAGSYSATVAFDLPHVQMLFLEENVLAWTVSNHTEKVGRYGAEAFGGVIAPESGQWKTFPLNATPKSATSADSRSSI
jgi:lipopolysaccharide transport system ATP-binding protein